MLKPDRRIVKAKTKSRRFRKWLDRMVCRVIGHMYAILYVGPSMETEGIGRCLRCREFAKLKSKHAQVPED